MSCHQVTGNAVVALQNVTSEITGKSTSYRLGVQQYKISRNKNTYNTHVAESSRDHITCLPLCRKPAN